MKNLKGIPEVQRYLRYHRYKGETNVPNQLFERVVQGGYNWASPKSVDVIALLKLLATHFQVVMKLSWLRDTVLMNCWLNADFNSGNRVNVKVLNQLKKRKFLPFNEEQIKMLAGETDTDLIKFLLNQKVAQYMPYWGNYGCPSEEGFVIFDSMEKMLWWKEHYNIFGRANYELVKTIIEKWDKPLPKPEFVSYRELFSKEFLKGRSGEHPLECSYSIGVTRIKILEPMAWAVKFEDKIFGSGCVADPEFYKERNLIDVCGVTVTVG